MTQVSTGHILARTATNPEHRLDCFRLVRPGEACKTALDEGPCKPGQVTEKGMCHA